MFDFCVRIVLTAAFLACPFCCVGNWNGAAGQSRAAVMQSCCCLCSEQHSEQPSPSCPEDDPGKSVCQGICGGAVIENQRSAVDPTQLDRSVAVLAPSMFSAGVSAQGGSPTDTLPQERRATTGRAIRCLYMSLLL